MREYLDWILYYIKHDSDKLQYASKQNKHMEYGMHIAFFLSYAVKHGSYGIAYAAQKQIHEAGKAKAFKGLRQGKNYGPAHAYVAYHGKTAVFFKVYGRKHSGN